MWVFLSLGTIWDLRKKSIPMIYLYVFGLAGIVYFGFGLISGKSIWEFVLAVLPGCIGIILSFLTGEQIGMGDGLVILCTGFFLSCRQIICVVFVAFMLLTVVSIVLLIGGRVNRKTRIPFIPFVLVGWIVCILGGIL